MRIERLRLKSFGHFKDTSLDLAAAPFVVLAGPNEAGKTTLLSAVRALLYGLGTSPLAEHSAVSIAATLSFADGSRAEVQRSRRGKKKEEVVGQLVTREGAQRPFGGDALLAALNGVDEATYSGVFGFRLDELEAGARGLTEAGLDTVLAGSALGGTAQAVLAAQQGLEEELQGLFGAHGNVKKRKLNEILHRVKGAAEQRDRASLRLEAYVGLERKIAELERELDRARGDLERLRGRKARAECLARVHGDAGALRETLDSIESTPVALLRPAETERAVELVAELRDHRKRVASLERELAARVDQLGAMTVDEALLAEAAAIEALHARSSTIAELRATIDTTEAAVATRAREVLRDARTLDAAHTVESLVARSVDRRTRDEVAQLLESFHDAGAQAGKEAAVLESAEKRVTSAEKRLTVARVEPNAALDALVDGLDEFRRASDAVQAHDAEATRALKEAARKAATLDPRIPHSDLSTVALPSLDLVTDTRTRWDAVQKRIDEYAAEARQCRASIAAQEAELKTLLEEQHVPDPAELQPARDRREAGWTLVRRAWLDGEDVSAEAQRYGADAPLVDAYELAVGEADRVVDALRVAATNVERIERLRCEIASGRALEANWADAEVRANSSFVALQGEWSETWRASGAEPRAPAVMASWLPGAEDVRALYAQAARDHEAATAAREQTAAFVSRAAPILGKAVEVDTVAAEVRRAHKAANDAAIGAVALQRELESARSEADAARRSTEHWNAKADAAERALCELWPRANVPADLAPKQGSEWLETLDTLTERARTVTAERDDLRRKRESLAAFDAEAGALLARLGESVSASPNAAVDRVHRELREAEKAATRRDEAAKEIQARRVALAQAAAEGEGLARERDDFLALAAAADETGLLAVVEDSRKRHALEARRDGLASRLAAELGTGAARDEDDAELAARSKAELVAEARELGGEIAALEARLEVLAQDLGGLRNEHEGLGGSVAAVAEAERRVYITEAQRCSAEVAALQVAKLLLDRTVERYARESRPTVLARASTLIQRLTAARWTAIEREPSSGVIELASADGARLEPGQLSRGTREQLFLALRLAFVLERSGVEPLPLLLDDVIVNFDPDRARAAMSALAEVAGEAQVIYLTCHPHLADLAQGHGAAIVHVAA